MSRFFISLLFLTFTFATIIGITRYYDEKVDLKGTLTVAQIEEIIKQNPTASSYNLDKNQIDRDTGLVLNTDSQKTDNISLHLLNN